MRHSLTGQALADLLTLIELHCLAPNLCHTNLKTFKNFFRNLKSPIQFHFYCENCFLYHGMEKVEQCMNCQTPTKKKSSAYFLVIPIISQLSSLLAGNICIWIIEFCCSAPFNWIENLVYDIYIYIYCVTYITVLQKVLAVWNLKSILKGYCLILYAKWKKI